MARAYPALEGLTAQPYSPMTGPTYLHHSRSTTSKLGYLGDENGPVSLTAHALPVTLLFYLSVTMVVIPVF